MTGSMSKSDAILRKAFTYLNRFLLLIFRLGLGGWGNRPEFSQILVLVHAGRKSGLRRYTPINFAIVDGDILCTAAFGKIAQWYKNIMADPNVEVWLPNGWYAGVAEEVPATDPRRDELMRQVLIASGFAAPLFAGMNPKMASDEELAATTANYRLLRIRRTEALSGPGGPSDLAWVWPVATLALTAICFFSNRQRSARKCGI